MPEEELDSNVCNPADDLYLEYEFMEAFGYSDDGEID